MSTSPININKTINSQITQSNSYNSQIAQSTSYVSSSPINRHIQRKTPNSYNNHDFFKYSDQNSQNKCYQPTTFQEIAETNLKKKINQNNCKQSLAELTNNKNSNATGLSFALIAPRLKVNKQKDSNLVSQANKKQCQSKLQTFNNPSLLSDMLMKKQTSHHNQNYNDINYTDSKDNNNKKRQVNYVQTSKSKMKSNHQKNNSCFLLQTFKTNLKTEFKNQECYSNKKYQNSYKKQSQMRKENIKQLQKKKQIQKYMSPITSGPQISKSFFKEASFKNLNSSKNIFQCSEVGSVHYSQIEQDVENSFRANSINNSINNSIRKSVDYDQHNDKTQVKYNEDFKERQIALSKIIDLNKMIVNKVKFNQQKITVQNSLNLNSDCLSSFSKDDPENNNFLNFSAFIQKNTDKSFLNNSINSQKGIKNGIDYRMSHQKNQKQSLSEFYQSILQNSSHSITKNDQVNTSFASITSYDNKSEISQSSSINFSKKFEKYKTKTQKKKIVTINDFDQIKQIGNGKYGKVTLVRNRQNGFICALKAVSKKVIKQDNLQVPFMRQIKIQLYLNHPNVVKLYGFFDDQNYIYLIMEYCSEGHLLKTIQAKQNNCFQQKQTLSIISDVFQAVSFLHSRGIIHRDLKPQNIVIQHGVHKLCDFGWAAYAENHMRTTFCGTPLYVSPQVLKGEQYDTKTDVWGLGVLTYQLIFGRVPFSLVTQHDMAKIINDPVYFPTWIMISRQMKELIQSMLDKNPRKRHTLNQILSKPIFIKFLQQCKRVADYYSKQVNLKLNQNK